ncbi:MAG: hypothetical protein ACOC70_01460, partial [bacterium]
VLYPCDRSTKAPPPARLVTTAGRTMIGAHVGGWLVLFGARKGVVEGEIAYRAPAGRTEHLVVDLKPDAAYRVGGIAEEPEERTASGQGVLRFATQKPGPVTLTRLAGFGRATKR